MDNNGVYFHLLPNELNEIIFSYLDSDDLPNVPILGLNWGSVHWFKYGQYIKLNYNEYLKRVLLEELRMFLKRSNKNYSMEELTNLEILNLSRYQLEEIPASVGQMTNLRELYLYNNKLKEIPASIGQLTNLQLLSLSDNKLKEIPDSIGQLTNLQELYLYGNRLKEIPASIDQLTNLQELYLSNNPLEYQMIDLINIRRKLPNLRSFKII